MLCCLSLAIGAVGCQTDGKADPTFNPPKSKTVVQTGTRARLRYPTDRLYFYQGTVRLFRLSPPVNILSIKERTIPGTIHRTYTSTSRRQTAHGRKRCTCTYFLRALPPAWAYACTHSVYSLCSPDFYVVFK